MEERERERVDEWEDERGERRERVEKKERDRKRDIMREIV